MSAPLPRTPDFSRRRKLVLAALLAGLLAVVMLVVAEATLRIAEHRRRPAGLPLMQENPHGTGSFRLIPGVRIRTRIEGREVLLSTNEHGMPWPSVTREKPPGIRRLAVVGDSFAFGLWADSAATGFCGQLAGYLRERGVELLNFGVGGYGYDDMELLLREEVLSFDPDLVMLVTYPANDIRDTYLGLDKYDVVDGVCVWDAGQLAAKQGRDVAGPGFLYRHSAVYRALFRLRHGAARRPPDVLPPHGIDSLTVSPHLARPSYWSQRRLPPQGEEAMEAAMSALERIHALLSGRGIGLSVVAVPYREQVYVRSEAGATWDIAFPQRHLEAFASSHSIPYLDLLPGLRRRVPENARRSSADLYMRTDPHLNQRGHDAVAAIMREWIETGALATQWQ